MLKLENRANTTDRVNTYLPKEYFKILLIGPSLQKAELLAQWFTSSASIIKGMYTCSYNKSQIVVIYRSPETLERQATTAAVEALLLFLESAEEFKKIELELQKYLNIPIKAIISSNDLSELAQSIKFEFFLLEKDPTRLKDELNRLDMEECSRIKGKFLEYDVDNSGYIDQVEMAKIAQEMGEDPKSEEFKKAMLTLDFNQDGKISCNEFFAWWKIGRQNINIFPKVYHLQSNAKSILSNILNVSGYITDIKEVAKYEDKVSCQKIYYKASGNFKIQTFLELGFAIGGKKRVEMANKYVSAFSKNTGITKSNWASLVVTMKKGTALSPECAKSMLNEFKNNLLTWGQRSSNPALAEFFNNLVVFETSTCGSNIVLLMRLKSDIEELIKNSLHYYIFILNNLFNPQEIDSFWMSIIANSNLDLCGTTGNTIGKFLQIGEVLVTGEAYQNRIKTLLLNLTEDLKAHSLFKAFCMLLFPLKFNMEYQGQLSELVDSKSKQVLDISLDNFSYVLAFLKKNLPKRFLESIKQIDLGLNILDYFARVKLNSKNLFTA